MLNGAKHLAQSKEAGRVYMYLMKPKYYLGNITVQVQVVKGLNNLLL